jgi:hypothetical protein
LYYHNTYCYQVMELKILISQRNEIIKEWGIRASPYTGRPASPPHVKCDRGAIGRLSESRLEGGE